jgi:hypothetical protein
LILYWPGVTAKWALQGPVAIFFGGMVFLYLVGIGWMAVHRTLGKAVL